MPDPRPSPPGRLAIVVAAVLLTLAGTGVAVSARPAPPRRTFLQVNLCGNVCNNGGLAVVAALEAAIAPVGPVAVTVDEVCERQYARLAADLTGFHVWFDPIGVTCHNGDRYGNVLVVADPDARLLGRWALPAPAGDEPRHLMCAAAGSLDLCVTHISNVSGNIGAQVARVAAILDGLGGRAVVLGGDFNTDPADPRLDPLYARCYDHGTGRLVEADAPGCARRDQRDVPVGTDQLNQETYPRHKYDDVFLGGAVWSDVHATVADVLGGRSDHHALWVSAATAL